MADHLGGRRGDSAECLGKGVGIRNRVRTVGYALEGVELSLYSSRHIDPIQVVQSVFMDPNTTYLGNHEETTEPTTPMVFSDHSFEDDARGNSMRKMQICSY